MREMDILEFSKEFKLDEKLFIVPTRTVGLLMINNIARRGGSVLNLNPITMRRLSLDICERYIEENDILFVDDILGESLVLDSIKSLEKEGDFFFKKELIDQNTAKEVYKVLMELKTNKIETFPKEKDLDIIYKRYSQKLRQLNALDYPDLIMKVIEIFQTTRFKTKIIGIAENIEFHNLERDLFNALSENTIKIKMPVKQLSNSPKEYFFKENKDHVDLDKNICFFNEYGMRNEIRYVIDDILEKQIPLDEVVIAYTDKKYVEEINLEFINAGLGISFSDGLDILSSTTYRFINTIFNFAKNYYSISEVRSLFFDDCLNIHDMQERSLYDELVKSGVFYGRENYKKLNFINPNLDDSSRIKREWLRDFFKDILFALPEEDLVLKEYIIRLSALIKKYVKVPNSLNEKSYDKVSMQSILQTLNKLEDIPLKVSTNEYFDMVISYIEEINIKRQGAFPGKAFACKYTIAGYSGRKHLYLIGLDSNSLDSKIVESPILLDKIRKDISLNLSYSSEGYRYKKYKIREAITADFETVSIGYSNFDMVDVKGRTPSNIYTELQEECEGEIIFIAEDKTLMGKDLVHSGTSLETLGQCSRKLYLKQKLSLRESEDIEIDLDRWLDPMIKGSLIHSVLNIYFDMPKSKRVEDILLDILEKSIVELEKNNPYILREVYNREKEEITSYCRDIVNREKDSDYEVFINELSFGIDKTNREFGPLNAQLIQIADLKLNIRGAIDRVDIDREGRRFRIVDYKTGSKKGFEDRLRNTTGRGANAVYDYTQSQKFQFYIYKIALENIISKLDRFKDFTVESFCYEFKDTTLELNFTDELLTEIESRIKSILDIDILLNDKMIIYDESDPLTCRYCEFQNICRTDGASLEGGESY